MNKRSLFVTLLCVVICLSISFPSYADESGAEGKMPDSAYSIVLASTPKSPFFDMSEYKEFGVALSCNENRIKAMSWDAVLPDGTRVEPQRMTESDTIAFFEAPSDLTGKMTIKAYIDDMVVSEMTVTIVEPRRNLEEVSEEKTYVLPNGVTVRAWVLKEGYKYYIEPDETEQNELQKDNESQDVKDDSNAVTTGWFGMIGAMVKQMAK